MLRFILSVLYVLLLTVLIIGVGGMMRERAKCNTHKARCSGQVASAIARQ